MMDFVEMRNTDFMNECRRQKSHMLAHDSHIHIDRMIALAARAEAPAYYIGLTRAYRVVSKWLQSRHSPQPPSRSARRAMIEEIGLKCLAKMARHPTMTLKQAVTEVISSERASSYFISLPYARRLYYRLLTSTHQRTIHRRRRKLF